MFAKIKEEIKQDYYVQNFSNDGQRFVAWYLRNIHIRDIRAAMQQYFAMLPSMPGGKDLSQKLKTALTMDAGDFESRWAAD